MVSGSRGRQYIQLRVLLGGKVEQTGYILAECTDEGSASRFDGNA